MTFGVDWLPGVAYAYIVIFARVGSMLMVLPAFGERIIPARMRLSFALIFALVLYPLVSDLLPVYPSNMMAAITILLHEIMVGLILGTLARLIVSATQTAGSVIAFQIGLSVATSPDPTQAGVQGAIIGSFLSFAAMALVFATDLHHMVLAGVYDSYMIFSPTTPLMFEDAAVTAVNITARSFAVGAQMAAPFIVFGLVFSLGLGLLSKLMPQLQVFFIAMPANIWVGLMLFALLLATMLTWYLTHFQDEFSLLMR